MMRFFFWAVSGLRNYSHVVHVEEKVGLCMFNVLFSFFRPML